MAKNLKKSILSNDDLPKITHIATHKLDSETLDMVEKIYGKERANELSFQDGGETEVDAEIKKNFRIKTKKINGWNIRTFHTKKKPEYLGIAIIVVAVIVIVFQLYTGKISSRNISSDIISAFLFMLIFAPIGAYLEYARQKKVRQKLENDESLKDNPDL